MTTTVNKENMRKFVDALRSGEYQQGHNALSKNGQFCCLGVACEVARKSGEVTIGVQHSGSFVLYDNQSDVLPMAVKNWLGVESCNPFLAEVNNVKYTAAECNDQLNYTFAKIADLFEGKYLNDSE